jgi:hypothetical protein
MTAEPLTPTTETVTVREAPAASFSFLKGSDDFLKGKDSSDFNWENAASIAREELSEAMNARNIAFLLGAGCSSYKKGGKQVGIPTMLPLADEFTNTVGKGRDRMFVNATERKVLKDTLGVDIQAPEVARNLERLMEMLHSYRFVLSRSVHSRHKRPLAVVNSVIKKIQQFVVHHCTKGAFSSGDETVLAFYETFYRKLVFRDRSLPRPWIFTTNYDLFNEIAMDRLGLPYCNGFSGTVERRFNPAVFRYALAEQLDITSRKWVAVDGFAYLCKLHGSITWTEDGHGLFPIRELRHQTRTVG